MLTVSRFNASECQQHAERTFGRRIRLPTGTENSTSFAGVNRGRFEGLRMSALSARGMAGRAGRCCLRRRLRGAVFARRAGAWLP